ncbi:co-chaperone DjlA [Zophobihabitans entericus]|uniref:Co-chaperone DjlA n=1 Tax=Zophobihabitans entericus TaxID=1635327 RepID=A0A6G9IAD6_9GAMM|nr:co-chaperone DjlA [Zophobihabitans entericus]QIQ20792.1 co-chaperone DjlA [Zophobihabitans entericus]
MSGLWGLITGAVFMLVFKMGFWGFLLGLFVGPMLGRFFYGFMAQKNANPTLFLSVTFEVLGHLSKAKGVVTQDDIKIANQMMDQLQLQGAARKLAQDSFNRGKDTGYPLRDRLKELYAAYRHQSNVLRVFCEQLIQAALNDGKLDDREKDILYIVAEEFHIPYAQMSMYIQMMMGSYQFHQRGGYSYQQQYQQQYQQSSGQRQSYQQPRGPSLADAYRVLGIDESADITTIKRAYRKLMNEHHPDKLVSKGLPKEMLEAAKQRAQEIQAAYDLIKSHKGFK